MDGKSRLLDFEGRWPTDLGKWFPAERVVFRGRDLFTELKDLPWMGLLLYGVTGRIPSADQITLFEGIWTLSTSYPDPRLWNNRIAALAGTTRSTMNLAVGAATAISEAVSYGHRANIRSIDALYRFKRRLAAGEELEGLVKAEMKRYRAIPGFSRPFTIWQEDDRNADERIAPLSALAGRLGMDGGGVLKLARGIEDITRRKWRMRMNVTALAAALAADQGMTEREYYHYLSLCFSAGVIPCYIDSLKHPEGAFFPVRCERIRYEGEGRRAWGSEGDN